jgi:hypothetical protein
LKKGSDYNATIYSFDPASESSTKIKIEQMKVNSDSVLNFEIAPNSGLAIHFRKTE